jgi:predicted NAD-dependent protein-ADP-ribosyltransferase YbiA (DUF1768 family)
MTYLLSLAIAFSLFSDAFSHSNRYPSEWWSPIEGDVAWWEIAPDSVGPESGKVILSKRNELGILSNFADTPFELDGVYYMSLEGLWQSMKYPESKSDQRYGDSQLQHTRASVAQMSGFDAKEAGSLASVLMKKFKINWVSYKNKKIKYRVAKKGEHFEIILRAMKAKLQQNTEVARILKKTGNLILLPDHKTRPKDPPAWKYYNIWMTLR